MFDGSLAALAPFGRLVTYGQSSGEAPAPLSVTELLAASRSVLGFWLVDALRRPRGLQAALVELISLVRAGRLRPVTGACYPLEEATRAHQDLLSRRTVGKLVLELHPHLTANDS